jgi:hypothetical protein
MFLQGWRVREAGSGDLQRERQCDGLAASELWIKAPVTAAFEVELRKFPVGGRLAVNP